MSEQTEDPRDLSWRIARSAVRLAKLVELNAPAYVIEKERRLLLSRVTAFPPAPKEICDELDEHERMSAREPKN